MGKLSISSSNPSTTNNSNQDAQRWKQAWTKTNHNAGELQNIMAANISEGNSEPRILPQQGPQTCGNNIEGKHANPLWTGMREGLITLCQYWGTAPGTAGDHLKLKFIEPWHILTYLDSLDFLYFFQSCLLHPKWLLLTANLWPSARSCEATTHRNHPDLPDPTSRRN